MSSSSTEPLRVALCVEGSADAAVRTRRMWLERIWNDHLSRLASCPRFDPVIPISKKDIVALDPRVPRSPGSEPLDMKLVRLGAGQTFDAAIVAWDLQPEWNGLGLFCRWEETKRLYELLAQSDVLPGAWREFALRKRDDYVSRASPSDRRSAPALVKGAVMPLCMEPEFEALLTSDERSVKRALEAPAGARNWPTGWNQPGNRQPGDRLLGTAIRALPPSSRARRTVRGGWRESKNEWGEFVLRRLLADPADAVRVANHPITRRLAEICTG